MMPDYTLTVKDIWTDEEFEVSSAGGTPRDAFENAARKGSLPGVETGEGCLTELYGQYSVRGWKEES